VFSLAIEKQPGEIVSIEERALQIAVKGGLIEVAKLRVEKGEKIGPFEFARLSGMKIGNRFEGCN
jgi:methionyl-tRNA formyltransferase